MEMLNSMIVTVADVLLGWLVHVPRDIALLIIAAGTAIILTVIRLWTTDQELLKRCKADRKTLKRLLKEAKRGRNKERIKQIKTTLGREGVTSFKAEIKPLLTALVPIVFIAVWCVARMEYRAPDGSAPVKLSVYTSVLDIGKLAHAVPQAGMAAETGWIRKIEEDHDEIGNTVAGRVDWLFTCEKQATPYTVEIRLPRQAIVAELAVNGLTYSQPVKAYGDEPHEMLELELEEYRPFGIIPAFRGFPGWLLGYLALVIPLSLIMKPAFGIY